jgi:NAD(P)-dependent dehydrogenase (short-subunit alcohol dehydrogenase family)
MSPFIIPAFFTNYKSLLQAGAAKVFISSRKAKACEAACKELNALPGLQLGAKAISVPADCATMEGIKSLVEAVKRETEFVDILLANAGATCEFFSSFPMILSFGRWTREGKG